MIWFGFRPVGSAWRRSLTFGTVGFLALGTFENDIQFYALLARGAIHAGIPLALSFLLTCVLISLMFAVLGHRFPQEQQPTHMRLKIAGVFLACVLAFPLLQMVCFGKTDYRRPADAAVVLGARAYADSRPSDALADRVRTACALYRDGLVRKLIFSGGPGDGTITEGQAMKRMALKLGVQAQDIVLDEMGVNTRATVKNTERIFRELHASRVLVVSHFYHLPRVKMAYHQAGIEVYTVPARESYLLRQLPYNMAREVAAFWTYYLRPVV
jgi:vancomycin permeability regulator SanA